MEDSEEYGTISEESSNEPSSEAHNPEYFREESDDGLDSWDNNWVIHYSDGSDASLDNEAVFGEYEEGDWGFDLGSLEESYLEAYDWGLDYSDFGSDYEGDYESDEGNVPEFLDGNTEDSDVSPNAESLDSQTNEPGTVLPEDMSLEALSDFINREQYDASSIGPLASEVFDRLASLLPEGLGTSDSDEQFGVPNFVDRLADGFQQSLGLSADEAQQLAQQVADGIQGAIDENKESSESSSDGADSSGSDVLGDNPDAAGSGSSASGKNQEAQGAPRLPTTAEEAARSDIQEFAVNLVLAAGFMAAFEYAVAAAAAAIAAGEAAAANAAAYQRYLDELCRQMGRPYVQDPRLYSLMDKLYRPNAQIGSGSTAEAVRYEFATGNPVQGKEHVQKAYDSIVALQKWISNNPTASPGDRAAAENVIRDLRNALRGR
jgi:hypothetical protein